MKVQSQSEFDRALEKAGKGDPEAQYQVGMCYLSGRFFERVLDQDKKKAVEYFRASADKGYEPAIEWLAGRQGSEAGRNASNSIPGHSEGRKLPVQPFKKTVVRETLHEAVVKELKFLLMSYQWGRYCLAEGEDFLKNACVVLFEYGEWIYGFWIVRLVLAITLLCAGAFLVALTILDEVYVPLFLCKGEAEWYIVLQCEIKKLHKYAVTALAILAFLTLYVSISLFSSIGFVHGAYVYIVSNEKLRRFWSSGKDKVLVIFSHEAWKNVGQRILSKLPNRFVPK